MENKDWTLEDLTKLMQELEQKAIDKGETTREQIEREAKFMELVSPYLHMTEEEMNESIPSGFYEISGNGLIAYTGKGGLIMVILAMQKQFKNIGDEKTK